MASPLPPKDAEPTSARSSDPRQVLFAAFARERVAVLEHPLYAAVNDVSALRVFMASHAFAVWDFMCLLKTLQQRLTCVQVPWLPPGDTLAARLINEIVMGEETDEVKPGLYLSHYDLYLAAMKEVEADSRPVRELVDSLTHGSSVEQVLEAMPLVPSTTRQFVQGNLRLCHEGSTVEVAAAFLLGREDLVPAMFGRLVDALEASHVPCTWFRLYLDRHIHLDGEAHGPMATRLLERLCGDSPAAWHEAAEAARAALMARRSLWDGVHQQIQLPSR